MLFTIILFAILKAYNLVPTFTLPSTWESARVSPSIPGEGFYRNYQRQYTIALRLQVIFVNLSFRIKKIIYGK